MENMPIVQIPMSHSNVRLGEMVGDLTQSGGVTWKMEAVYLSAVASCANHSRTTYTYIRVARRERVQGGSERLWRVVGCGGQGGEVGGWVRRGVEGVWWAGWRGEGRVHTSILL